MERLRTVDNGGGKRVRHALLILFGLLAAALIAVAAIKHNAGPGTSAAVSPLPADTSKPAAKPATSPANHQSGRTAATKPAWAELTAAQQTALAPLAPEWDQMPLARKTKWLAIGNKFASMSPAEQQRVQKRMSEWMKLTPQQRRVARDSFTRAKKLGQDQKSARWEQYQQLPPEQKEELAKTTIKKRVTTLPPAHGGHKRTAAPMKSTPQPVLEQALTPQPGGHLGATPTNPAPAPALSAVSPEPPATPSPMPSESSTPAPIPSNNPLLPQLELSSP